MSAKGLLSADCSDLRELIPVLQQYRQVSRKSWDEILQHEAREWGWELNKVFKQIRPTPASIIRAAEKRKFQVKRQGNSITKTAGGVSAAADAAADNLLAGDKSDYFRVEINDNGVFIKPVRFGASRSQKLLKGGRSGRKFSDAARRASEVSEEALQAARASDPSIKRLNKRALSVGLELSLRSRAAKGGLLALQWLPDVWKTRKSSTLHNGPLVVRSRLGVPLGTVEFSKQGETIGAEISALVPGAGRQIVKHGYVEHVERVRVSDRLAYILPRLEAAKKKALASHTPAP